ncbi:MAG: chemotaxis protein CheD [Deltaproteobacteria bacterium]|nr:chemotaxis protein CheD [Deltaproteobacteria bacterium]
MPGSDKIDLFKYFLEPGYIFFRVKPTLISTVLGNCVAVCLFDRRQRWGGMTHFLYPKACHADEMTPKYGNVAVPALIRMLIKQGSMVEDLEAQIFGGAKSLFHDESNQGWQNVQIAQKTLKKEGIPVCSQDVCGLKGRRIIYHTSTNEVIVMKTDKIRQGDWFPYPDHSACQN